MKNSEKNSDWWWIDYMEDELDPTTLVDIEFLLEKSPSDRQEYESWRLLKSWVKEVDVVKKDEVVWDSKELLRLKNRTLKAISVGDRKTGDQTPQIGIRVL